MISTLRVGLRNIPIRYAGLLRHCVSRNDTSKNRHRGNGNTQVCILPRASLGLLLYSAQVIFTLKTRWAKTQTAIPCDDLFGEMRLTAHAFFNDIACGDDITA